MIWLTFLFPSRLFRHTFQAALAERMETRKHFGRLEQLQTDRACQFLVEIFSKRYCCHFKDLALFYRHYTQLSTLFSTPRAETNMD